jgi:hypothetical protein
MNTPVLNKITTATLPVLKTTDKRRRILFNTIIITTLLTDLFPIFGMWFLKWNVFGALFLYWIDNQFFYLLTLSGFIWLMRRNWKRRIWKIIVMTIIFAFYNSLQAFLIFVFNGQFFLRQKGLFTNAQHFTIVEFIQITYNYIVLLTPQLLYDYPTLWISVVMIVANHVFELVNPYHSSMFTGLGSLINRLGIPTFAILMVATLNFINLLLHTLVPILSTVAFYAATLFFVVKAAYDVKRLIERARDYGEL